MPNTDKQITLSDIRFLFVTIREHVCFLLKLKPYPECMPGLVRATERARNSPSNERDPITTPNHVRHHWRQTGPADITIPSSTIVLPKKEHRTQTHQTSARLGQLNPEPELQRRPHSRRPPEETTKTRRKGPHPTTDQQTHESVSSPGSPGLFGPDDGGRSPSPVASGA